MGDRLDGDTRQGYMAVVMCIFGASAAPLFYKMAYAAGMHPLWVNVFRLLITTLIMAVIAFASPKNRRAILQTSKHAFWISALAGTLLALHFNSWALSLTYTDTFAASTILGINVLLTVLFASLFLKERTSKSALVGLVIATAGTVVCNFGGGVGRFGGNMLALFAAVAQALYILCGRKVRGEMGTVAYTTILYAFTLFWMVLMALFVDLPAPAFTGGIFWAGLLAIFPTLLGHSMANVALKYFKAATVSAVMMSGLITGPLVVVIFLGERPTVFTVVGGMIILIGLVLYLISEWRTNRQTARDAAAEIEE